MTEYFCCDKPTIVDTREQVYCSNCSALLDDLCFEESLSLGSGGNSKIRFNKFFKVISDYQLPWYVRQQLLDLFPMIESYFYDSQRINFINMNQLAYEMCNILGYSEYSEVFSNLKTKARIRQIKQFVASAVDNMPKNNIPVQKLCDIPLINITLKYELDMSKVVTDEHIYTSFNINAEESDKAPKVKAKADKVKAKVVLRLVPKGFKV